MKFSATPHLTLGSSSFALAGYAVATGEISGVARITLQGSDLLRGPVRGRRGIEDAIEGMSYLPSGEQAGVRPGSTICVVALGAERSVFGRRRNTAMPYLVTAGKSGATLQGPMIWRYAHPGKELGGVSFSQGLIGVATLCLLFYASLLLSRLFGPALLLAGLAGVSAYGYRLVKKLMGGASAVELGGNGQIWVASPEPAGT